MLSYTIFFVTEKSPILQLVTEVMSRFCNATFMPTSSNYVVGDNSWFTEVRQYDLARFPVSAVLHSAVKRSIGEVVQSRKRPLLGPSP